MEMIGKLRRMHFRDGLSLHQIAKRTGISRNTIRKWVRAPKPDNPPKYARRTTPGKLTAHIEFLQTALKADALRPKDRVSRGKDRVVNSSFAVMCAHYLFDPDFCNVASGWEKGVIEKNGQDSRRRIWLEAQQLAFVSFVELNLWLGQRCQALWTELQHPEYKGFTSAEMLEQ
jgi:transposase